MPKTLGMEPWELIVLAGVFFVATQTELFDRPGKSPLDIGQDERREWLTFTTQKEKNEQVELYFKECGYPGDTASWAWCQSFVSYCCLKAGLPLSPGKKQFISTGKAMDYFKDRQQFHNAPTVGDIGYMALSGGSRPSHVGFVVTVHSSKHITFLEGNYSNTVSLVERKRTLDKVLGYVTPARSPDQ